MANLNTMNLTRVLRLIWLNRGISRIEVSRQLELDKSTITNIVNRLIKKNLIITLEEGESSTKGGRKPVGLAINDRLGLILGLEITTDRIMATAVNIQREIIFTKKIVFEQSKEPLDELFFKAMEELSQEIEKCKLPLIGIGIGFSGLVDPEAGVIRKSIPLDIKTPYPFIEKVRERYQVPVLIDNDANCCCWDEMVSSNRNRSENFIYVLAEDRLHSRSKASSRISFAVGFGLVLNGELLHGYEYSAGEFKSILWKDGNTNQFSISDEIMAAPEKFPNAIKNTIHELASHVAFLSNVLNLSLVVVGGLDHYGEEVLNIFSEEIQHNWSYKNQNIYKVCLAHNGAFAVSSGAAGMFLERMFTMRSSTATKEGIHSSLMSGYEMIRNLQDPKVNL